MTLKAKLRKTLSSRSLSAISRSKVIPTMPDIDPFCHSEPLENVHHRPSEAFTTLPSRVHKQDAERVESVKLFSTEIMSAISQPQSDFPCRLNSSVGHLSSLLFPECIPERLDAVAMILEGAALHHVIEHEELGSAMSDYRLVSSILRVGASRPGQGLMEERFVSQMALESIAKYGEEGQVLAKRIFGGWLQPMEKVKDDGISLEDFISRRIVSAGTRALWSILEFSLGILLFEEEMQQIEHIVDVADRIFVKTNDYFSWETGRESGDRALNSIRFLIKTEGRSEQQAREKLKIEILRDEKNYQYLSKRFLQSSPNAPARVRKFLTMLEVLLGGHHIWCAAYNVHDSSSETEVGENETDVCTVEQKGEMMDLHLASDTTLDYSALLDPVHYIESLPSKNMRSKVIDAFNVWFQLPNEQINTIKAAIEDVHHSTLILDDIQDSSSLRRGFAATHHVFSSAQCINSATYMVARAASRVAAHQDHPQIVQIFLRGLRDMALGQSWDLSWRATGHCPSTAEYMAMVDGKTGAMFEMTLRMMEEFSAVEKWPMSELNQFAKILGRWYQVRDDYQNLQDEQYTAQKGFCEDLDEGKLSYPLTVCCSRDPVAQRIIMGIFRQRQEGTPLALNVKMQILDLFRRTGALQHTWDVIQELQKTAEGALSNLESVIGNPNPNFRIVVSVLGNIPPRPSPDSK